MNQGHVADIGKVVLSLRITRRQTQALLAAFLLIAAAGCAEQTVRAPAPVAPVGDARRGEYLTAIFACQECHTLRQPDGVHLDRQLLFAGGIPFKGAWGLVHTANVTVPARQFPAPVLESAIRGRLTFKFQMPTDLYSAMAADDMRDVVAFLKNLDPVPRPLPENRFEPGYLTPGPVPDGPVPERAPLPGTPERGRYLARLSICQDCHSPRTPDGRRPGEPGSAAAHYDQERLFGGGGLAFRFADGRWLIPPNLTPDPETGLGRWSEADMVKAIRTGATPDGRQLNPMMPYLVAFHGMTDQDVLDIVRFLRSLKPVKARWPRNPRYGATEPPPDCCFMPPLAPVGAPVASLRHHGNRP